MHITYCKCKQISKTLEYLGTFEGNFRIFHSQRNNPD
uniref:Uncharacterized protein n=1 Tax=Anguilla anguilla TaxID=7936 RepID=A0A0E9XGG8_ANGAN